jgi:RNA-directed DNA polymerase
MPHTETGKTWAKLSLISEHAKREPLLRFTSLAHMLDKEFLKDCYNSLNRNKAVGVDDVSWEDYGRNLDENLELRPRYCAIKIVQDIREFRRFAQQLILN